MTKSIRIDLEAEEEIAHAIDRYETEREGLGAELWDELRAAIRTLEAPGPECGPVIGLPRELGVYFVHEPREQLARDAEHYDTPRIILRGKLGSGHALDVERAIVRRHHDVRCRHDRPSSCRGVRRRVPVDAIGERDGWRPVGLRLEVGDERDLHAMIALGALVHSGVELRGDEVTRESGRDVDASASTWQRRKR